jgi:hypothetical protein
MAEDMAFLMALGDSLVLSAAGLRIRGEDKLDDIRFCR